MVSTLCNSAGEVGRKDLSYFAALKLDVICRVEVEDGTGRSAIDFRAEVDGEAAVSLVWHDLFEMRADVGR